GRRGRRWRGGPSRAPRGRPGGRWARRRRSSCARPPPLSCSPPLALARVARMLRSRLTYANVVATLALFIALGGTSVAASSLISGSKIKKNSIPADRIVKHSLTATQINVAKLGVVPSAAHAAGADSGTQAASADTAAHAGTADHAATADAATNADNANLLEHQDMNAFAPTDRVEVGVGDSTSTTVQTILDYPDMNLRVETDGN